MFIQQEKNLGKFSENTCKSEQILNQCFTLYLFVLSKAHLH